MSAPILIRMGGYGPPTTGFSKALKFIGDKLSAQFGDRLDISLRQVQRNLDVPDSTFQVTHP